MGAANVTVHAGQPGGQVRSRRKQLKRGSIVCRAGAGVQACEHLLPECWGTAFFPIQRVLRAGRAVGMLGRGGAMQMLN